MRGHLDRVTSAILGCVNNRLIGLLMLNMHQIAPHARRRRDILCYVQILARESRHAFSVFLRRVSDHVRVPNIAGGHMLTLIMDASP
jgi:hypothetical protein